MQSEKRAWHQALENNMKSKGRERRPPQGKKKKKKRSSSGIWKENHMGVVSNRQEKKIVSKHIRVLSHRMVLRSRVRKRPKSAHLIQQKGSHSSP